MFREKLNEVLASRKPFISDRLNRISFGLSVLVNIIHWLILYIKIKPSDEEILLKYSVVYGADVIDRSSYIYLIPSVALVLLIVNFLFSAYFYRKENLAAYFLNYATIGVQLIFLAASLVLIGINT